MLRSRSVRCCEAGRVRAHSAAEAGSWGATVSAKERVARSRRGPGGCRPIQEAVARKSLLVHLRTTLETFSSRSASRLLAWSQPIHDPGSSSESACSAMPLATAIVSTRPSSADSRMREADSKGCRARVPPSATNSPPRRSWSLLAVSINSLVILEGSAGSGASSSPRLRRSSSWFSAVPIMAPTC